MKLSLILLLLLIVFQSCATDKVGEIKIGETLYENQSYTENLRFKSLIQNSLQKDKNSFVDLIEFDCSGAGCYDLGGVIVQIIYQTGEENTVELVKDLTPELARRLHVLISAGLEYGTKNHEKKNL